MNRSKDRCLRISGEPRNPARDLAATIRTEKVATGMGPLLILEVEKDDDGRVEQWHFKKPYPVLSFAEVTKDDTGKSQIFINGGSYSISNGEFRSFSGKPMKRLDTSKTSERLPEIVDRFRKTHGGRNPKDAWDTVVDIPSELVRLGRLYAVTYDADKGDGVYPYRHPFEGRARPMVCSDTTGRRLFLVGGSYTVTPHGIEDRRK